MVDITKYPYFSYNQIVNSILDPIKNQADLQLINFSRIYPNREKFLISLQEKQAVSYYASELYRYGVFENKPESYESRYNMWDHLSSDPYRIYEYARVHDGLAHGLSITQQHGTHLDLFVFATNPGNAQINNFYINHKEMFSEFIEDFYGTLSPTIETLSHHRFKCPGNHGFHENPIQALSPREQDCALLMSAGLCAKEIGKILELSPRTVQEYITAVRTNFETKNHTRLLEKLKKYL